MNENKKKFDRQFCKHFFSLANTEKNGNFARCEGGCGLEFGEVIEMSKALKKEENKK